MFHFVRLDMYYAVEKVLKTHFFYLLSKKDWDFIQVQRYTSLSNFVIINI